MREIQWDNGDGTVTRGIAFPCRRKSCRNEVRIDEHHPDFAALKASQDLACNACIGIDHVRGQT